VQNEDGEVSIQLVEMKTVKLSPKIRITIIIIAILLGVNSLNLILDKIIWILITVEIFVIDNTNSVIFEYYTNFCWIWLDLVTLVNSLFFMILFKNVAIKQIQMKEQSQFGKSYNEE
jgi:hypothetical protein